MARALPKFYLSMTDDWTVCCTVTRLKDVGLVRQNGCVCSGERVLGMNEKPPKFSLYEAKLISVPTKTPRKKR